MDSYVCVALFADITVEAGAQLILARDISVLFANRVLIQPTGQIVCQGKIVKFDCASLLGHVQHVAPNM